MTTILTIVLIMQGLHELAPELVRFVHWIQQRDTIGKVLSMRALLHSAAKHRPGIARTVHFGE